MEQYARPQSHSEYIARWRMYQWFQFLENGDDSHFIIAEDIIMAKKYKNKMNRMEVMTHINTIILPSNFLYEYPDKSGVLTTTAEMIRTNKKIDNDARNSVMAISEKSIPTCNYGYVTENNEIVVSGSSKDSKVTGKDVLAMFQRVKDKKIKYENKYITAVQDKSGYCCLYYVDSKNKLSPIEGIQAKIIGAQVLADAAKIKLSSQSESIMLIQKYKTNGTPEGIAEYYSSDLESNGSNEYNPVLSMSLQTRKEICQPLLDIIADIKAGNFSIDTSLDKNEILFIINKIFDLTNLSKLDNTKLAAKVEKYQAAIHCLFGRIKDPAYKKYFEKPSGRLHSILEKTTPLYTKKDEWDKIDEKILSFEISFPKEEFDKKHKLYNDDLKIRVEQVSEHMKNSELEIELLSGETLSTHDSEKPEFIKIERKDNGSLLFSVGAAPEKVTYTRTHGDFSSKNPDIYVEPGDISRDMNHRQELTLLTTKNNITKKSIQYLHGAPGLRQENTSDDVYTVSDNLQSTIYKALTDCSAPPSNKDTIAKVSYLIMVGTFFQASYQVLGMANAIVNSPLAIDNNDTSTVDPTLQRFVTIRISDAGDAEVTLTHISRLVTINNTSLIPMSDHIAMQSIIKVNLCDPNPKFTMTQRAEMKPVAVISPESFFNESADTPKPKAKFMDNFRRPHV